ncbi:MAG TPA: PSD1 and planctomycete cytochrome C domain-containing protein [Gemmata sp.]|jgi:cytochrome c553|nr:PSD1 and planctomycete cytochrome C domain-containing protein [Gemmata sp.]
MSGPLRCVVVVVQLALLTPASAIAQDAAAVEFFEKKVRPLLTEHCLKCHGAPGEKVRAKLKVTDRAALLAGGETGPSLVPGNPEKSLLIEAVKYDGDLKMPPKGKLTDTQIADLTKWVKDGAVWPETAAGTTGTKPNGPLFTEAQKKYWAFQPIREPVVPTLNSHQATTNNPIDSFIRAKLEAAKLKPAPEADRRVLIRRITFDLTGLPPTPEEVEAFVADTAANAWEKAIDRLLASPAYGERWGRHWLDVARYADSNGLDENTAFGNAWRYRDYVIQALNADKPFDRFVKEQIAGDLLADSGPEKLTATGFLVLGPKILAEPDKQKMVMDIVDEQIDVVSKAFLGLTISCARCHDHKFDPIPTRDYYALAGIFKSTKTMATLNTVARVYERRLNAPDTPETLAYRAEVEQLRKELKSIERRFSMTPATDKEKRSELRNAAEVRRSEIKRLEAQVPAIEMALAVQDEPKPADVKVHIRGNHLTLGEIAPRIFPRIIAGEQQKPAPTTASGRLQFAEWIASPSNPLTARVIVNRVWQHHFGEGIVRSPDNFGSLGERPTHPELLDWLAARFIKDGWSLKKLHKLILMSATYQQALNPEHGTQTPEPNLVDPDNRLLWHFNRQRLEAEAIRDAIFFVAGSLDRTTGGSLLNSANFEYVTNDQSGTKIGYDTYRRSIYLPVVRNNVYDFLQAFDFVEPHVLNGKRANTVVAPQALFMMNNPLVTAQAKTFAESLLKFSGSDEDRAKAAYSRAFARAGKPEEISRAVSFLHQYEAALPATEKDAAARRLKAWQAFCHVLYSSSEFVTVE